MKILFFTRSLDIGGSERQIVALANGMKRLGHDVAVMVMYPGGALEHDLKTEGTRLISLDKKGRWEIFGFAHRLVRGIRVERPDILHSFLTTQNIIAAVLKPLLGNTKVVWGVRSSNVDLSRYDSMTKMASWLETLVAGAPDHIIVNSRDGHERLKAKGYPTDRISAIPNGIDTGRYVMDKDAGRKVREEWGIAGDKMVIGHVGRLDPMKDHPTFLKASAIISAEKDNLVFVCVGGGPGGYGERMRRLAEDIGIAGRVIWAGSMNDMPSVHNAFDIEVCSSYGEGFPNSIGEAMACGTPCVVTNVGDLAWIVGDTGIIVPPSAPDKLAEGMRAMLDRVDRDPVSVSRPSRERVVDMFSVERLLGNTIKTLESLL